VTPGGVRDAPLSLVEEVVAPDQNR
jgi:hypothetical protein